jgi:hypothetical protein
MKKYICTETQIKSVIDSIMNEHIIKEQRLDLMKLKDLTELVSRLGYEKEVLLKIFIEMYRKEGSEGVIKVFKSATNLDLEDFGYGRFNLKN